jgi:hypothetical protein
MWFLVEAGCPMMTAVLGGAGVFCLTQSFEDPVLGAHAFVLLISATGLLLAGEADFR